MKKSLVVVAAIAMVIAMVGGAWAGSTNSTVGATANVVNVCAVTGGTIDFGIGLDAVNNSGVVPANVAEPTIKCTMGATVHVTDDMGANEAVSNTAPARLKKNSDYIEYSFSYNTAALAGLGIGNPILGLALAANIPAGKLANAPAGDYSDTLTLTISY